MENTYQVYWAGQLCTVVDQTASKVRIQFTNATGFCDMWLDRSARLYYATKQTR